eukprot:scaffold7134_cov168-Cylindrotheca_fusiformis.AAC.1
MVIDHLEKSKIRGTQSASSGPVHKSKYYHVFRTMNNKNNEHHEDGRNETALVPYDATAQASEGGAIVMLGALQLQFKQFWT